MDRILIAVLFAGGLFAGILVVLEWGRRLGNRNPGQGEAGSRAGLGAVEGAVFALMGLLIAFTFSGAATRFDARREMIVQEANAIGTAWLRIDLLPSEAQPALRDLFRRYLDARLATYKKLPDLAAARDELARSKVLQGEIWTQTIAAGQKGPAPLVGPVTASLNEMFDIAMIRTAAAQMHPPLIIYLMLGVLALMSALLAGYAMAGGPSRSWMHTLGFAALLGGTVYVILDLEFPRIGLVRIDAADRILEEVRNEMK